METTFGYTNTTTARPEATDMEVFAETWGYVATLVLRVAYRMKVLGETPPEGYSPRFILQLEGLVWQNIVIANPDSKDAAYLRNMMEGYKRDNPPPAQTSGATKLCLVPIR
jgi:hypothetical protein